MTPIAFAITCAVIALLLVLTRRKTHDDRSRKGYWQSREIKYRSENKPFAPSKELRGLDSVLTGDTDGKFGEAITSALVERTAAKSKGRYSVLQNVYIPTHAGYTEIDTVLLHETGIYVFETKNISGEISGSMEAERWEQEINPRIKHTLYNPIRQNMGHTGALLRQLHIRLDDASAYSFVVFSDRSILRNVPASGKFGKGDNGWQVVHLGELGNALGKLLGARPAVYRPAQIEKWHEALRDCVNVDDSIKKKHRASVAHRH